MVTFQSELRDLLDGYLAAYGRRNADDCAAFYTEDAEIFSPFGPPASGRAAIRALHQGWFREEEENKRLDILSAEARNGLAYAVLRYCSDTVGGSEGGHSLNIIKEMQAGHWQFQVTSLNADFEAPMSGKDQP